MSFSNFLLAKKLTNYLVENASEHPISDVVKEWLSNFFWSNHPDNVPRGELLSELIASCGTNEPIYRPYSFYTKEQLDEFLADTKNGTQFSSDEITKWFTNKNKVSVMARNGSRHNDYWSDDTWSKKKRDDVDHMRGEHALVVKISPSSDIAFSTESITSASESVAVALMPGTYKMEIVENHVPFMKSIDDSNFKEKFMSIKSVGDKHFWGDEHDYERSLFKHILYHYKDFDSEMQDHLFSLMIPFLKQTECLVSVSGDTFSIMDEYINIEWTLPDEFFYYVELLNDKQQDEFDEIIKGLFRKIDKEFRQKTARIDWISKPFQVRVAPSIMLALKLERYEKHVHFAKFLIQKIQLIYQKLNSYEETRRINAIEDPNAKRDAINSVAKRIANALDQMKIFLQK